MLYFSWAWWHVPITPALRKLSNCIVSLRSIWATKRDLALKKKKERKNLIRHLISTCIRMTSVIYSMWCIVFLDWCMLTVFVFQGQVLFSHDKDPFNALLNSVC